MGRRQGKVPLEARRMDRREACSVSQGQPASVPFFVPDGDGGHLPPDKAGEMYDNARQIAASQSFWGGSFTDRRVFEVVSEHNGTTYVNRVGDLTRDRKFVVAIFESLDERDRQRYVVQSVGSTIHVDPEKIRSVRFFA
jgi:hypothetical protein